MNILWKFSILTALTGCTEESELAVLTTFLSISFLQGCCKNATETSGEKDSTNSDAVCTNCPYCYSLWEGSVSKGVKLAGGLGLIFSFTQVCI